MGESCDIFSWIYAPEIAESPKWIQILSWSADSLSYFIIFVHNSETFVFPGGLLSYFRNLLGSREMRILILGLDGAGKTTILYRFGLHWHPRLQSTWQFTFYILLYTLKLTLHSHLFLIFYQFVWLIYLFDERRLFYITIYNQRFRYVCMIYEKFKTSLLDFVWQVVNFLQSCIY